MARPYNDIPVVEFSEMDIWSGRFPSVLAHLATEVGLVFRRVLRQGPFAGTDTLYMVGPEANRFVMHTHRDAFSHERGWTPIIGEVLGQGLLNMDDPEHTRHRKLWNPAFTSAYMETYLPLMQRIIAERTARWAERGVVDMYQEVREITFDVAATALAGVPRGPQADRMQQLFYRLIVGDRMGAQSYETWLEEATRARSELTELLLLLIAERRAMPSVQAPRDVLGLIVHARDEDGEALTDEQVLGHVDILLVAGHETTTVLGAYTLYRLATMHEARDRVLAELDEVLGDERGPVSVEATHQLRELEYFVRETGRLNPPVFNVPRGVVRDVEFAGYTIPAGTTVRLALAACHRLPDIFTDPDLFDPQRFAPPREEDRRVPYSLVTFGGGPRLCIGINFANIEVKALAVHVLRHYRLEPVSAEPPVQIGFTATMLPAGAPLRVASRT
jgi:retinoid hydroxylase